MQCDRAIELIGAYLDQELDAETRREVAAHLGGCAACAALGGNYRSVNRHVATLGRVTAPEHLVAGVRSHLAGAAVETATLPFLTIRDSRFGLGWLRRVAVLLLACGVTAAVTALVMSRMADTAALERDVAAAHVRSLLQESPIQIASSETHVVKPWFAGRLDFAPSVRDLTADGFPFAGARLDFIGERRVAALVYRRRLQVVNVFLWPASDSTDSAPRDLVHRGYNMVSWSRSGIVYWAISDLNVAELRLLQSLL
jgi:anti-sigma factor RsiW